MIIRHSNKDNVWNVWSQNSREYSGGFRTGPRCKTNQSFFSCILLSLFFCPHPLISLLPSSSSFPLLIFSLIKNFFLPRSLVSISYVILLPCLNIPVASATFILLARSLTLYATFLMNRLNHYLCTLHSIRAAETLLWPPEWLQVNTFVHSRKK